MASVTKRVQDGSTTDVTRLRDETGKQRKRSVARNVDADRSRAEIEHSLTSGSYVDPLPGGTCTRRS